MTTPLQFNENQPDKLIENLEIKLTTEQHTYLQENTLDKRTLLWKKFNLRFNTQYSKMQITRAIEVLNEPKVKKSGVRNPK